jgi:hypothetical protein
VGVDVSSLGYAQGIHQITGQEFDHATSQIASIISQAMWVQRGWFLAYGQWIFWPIILIGVQSLKLTKKNRRRM